MSHSERADVLRRARRYLQHNQCPLPLDMIVELMVVGIDASTLENDALYGGETGEEEHGA